jgi:hypothetical protein
MLVTFAAVIRTDAHIRESLATAFVQALMRLFAGVSANVHRQSAALDEALAAAWDHASVWALICVNSEMSLQV